MSQDWYRFLRHDLLSDGALEREKEGDDSILPKKLENSLKNLKIITFNYDVSLEYYLYDTLTLVLGKPGAQAALEKLEILHVYGQIRGGYSPLKIADYGDSSSEYTNSWRSAPESAPHISVIGEHKSRDEDITKQTKEMLKDAETLAFFGFGFDKENLKVLGLNNMSFSSALDPDPCKNPMGWIQGSQWPTHGAAERLQLNNQGSAATILYTNYEDRGKVNHAINRLFKLDELPKTTLRKSTGSVAKALANDFDLL
jgi:hypothetical protein